MKRPKLGDRELALLAFAATALLGLLWFFYLYSPARERIAALTLSNQQLESDITLGRAARDNLPALRRAVAELERQRAIFLAQLPRENEVAELLDQLREAAQEAQVDFTTLQNTGTVGEVVAGVRLLSFSLGTEGTYGETIAFLRTLEELPRFTEVLRVGLLAEGEGSSDPVLSAAYDFTVYVFTGNSSEEGAAETAGEVNE